MEYLLKVQLRSRGDYAKFSQHFQGNPEWELIRPREERGRLLASVLKFGLKKKDLRIVLAAFFLSLAADLVKLGISEALLDSDDGANQIRIENYNHVEIKVNGNIILNADSCTVQQLIDLAKKSE